MIPTVKEHFDAWLDYECTCGFPHPKPGKFGPPPQLVKVDGVWVRYPRYTGVMGDYRPVEC